MATVKANCRKVVCIGRNYVDHISELSNATPKQPFWFLKPSSSILPPKSGPILRPKGTKLHYEVELACIIGKEMTDVPEDKGLEGVKGYVVAIDLTARNIQDEAKKKGLPWTIAKGFDTFCPISQFIPKASIPDPHNATLWLSINDKMRQDDSTELMMFKIPRLVSEVSKVMTLEEGDLVLTGTPKGVGEIKEGEIVKAGIRVDGKELEEGGMELEVKEKPGLYSYGET